MQRCSMSIKGKCKLKPHLDTIFHPWNWQKSKSSIINFVSEPHTCTCIFLKKNVNVSKEWNK